MGYLPIKQLEKSGNVTLQRWTLECKDIPALITRSIEKNQKKNVGGIILVTGITLPQLKVIKPAYFEYIFVEFSI